MTLHPEIAILLLKQLQLLLPLNVDVLHAALTVATDDLLGATEHTLAAKARFLDFSEFEEAHVGVTHRGLEYVAHVLP